MPTVNSLTEPLLAWILLDYILGVHVKISATPHRLTLAQDKKSAIADDIGDNIAEDIADDIADDTVFAQCWLSTSTPAGSSMDFSNGNRLDSFHRFSRVGFTSRITSDESYGIVVPYPLFLHRVLALLRALALLGSA